MVLKVLSDLGVDMQGMTEAQVEGLIKSTQNMTQTRIQQIERMLLIFSRFLFGTRILDLQGIT